MASVTFSVEDVLDRVRLLKGDSTYSPTAAVLWTYDGLIELYMQAPNKVRQDEAGQTRPFPAPFAAIADTVPCRIEFMPLLVDYVLARALMSDGDSQEHAQRADKHFELFFRRAHWIEHGPLQFADRTLGPVKGVR